VTTAQGVADFQDAQRSRRPVATLGLAHKTRLYQVNITTLTRTAGLLVLQCPGDAAGTTRGGGLGRLRRHRAPAAPSEVPAGSAGSQTSRAHGDARDRTRSGGEVGVSRLASYVNEEGFGCLRDRSRDAASSAHKSVVKEGGHETENVCVYRLSSSQSFLVRLSA
jgi:hypothetical protein